MIYHILRNFTTGPHFKFGSMIISSHERKKDENWTGNWLNSYFSLQWIRSFHAHWNQMMIGNQRSAIIEKQHSHSEIRNFHRIHPLAIAQWFRTLWKSDKNIPLSHELRSEWESERCGASKRVSGASERASGWASGLLIVSRFHDRLNHCAVRIQVGEAENETRKQKKSE